MPEVWPFRGVRYNLDRVRDYDRVITPPWDVIAPDVRETLRGRSPHNVVNLILPQEREGKSAYEAAAADLDAWLAEGALQQERAESFYLIEQTFHGLDGCEHVRRGFFGLAKIPEDDENTVLGHERTFDHKVRDRLQLMEATAAQFGAIFVLYDDPERALGPFLDQMLERPEDIFTHTVDDVSQRIWRVDGDPQVTAFFRERTLYIADGHHRFRTATLYRDKMREREQPSDLQPYDYVFMGFVPFDDPGLFIYAPHRVADVPGGFDLDAVLAKLAPWFDAAPVDGDLLAAVDSAPGCAIGLAVSDSRQVLLQLRDGADREDLLGTDHGPAWRDLDVAVLHRGVLERAVGMPEGAEYDYEPDAAAALGMVARGEKGLACLLKPTRPEQVAACADAGEFMPQKATYFFPKLPTGGVFHRMR
jgi:uncharacterized protein (DUF1015 family)